RRDRRFSSAVFGPLLFSAFWRVAPILRREGMGGSTPPPQIGIFLPRSLFASCRLGKRSELEPMPRYPAAARPWVAWPARALRGWGADRSEPFSTTAARCASGGARGGAGGRAER